MMRYGKSQNKTMIVAILVIVLGISIGFAAFSSSLRIKSKLSVNPSDSTFSVVFTSMEYLINDKIVTDDITPQKIGPNTNNIEATDAQINNSGTYPTISNLTATLKEPGQGVKYEFYSRNTGQHNAYLTSVVYQPLSSGKFIECKAKDGTSETAVAEACEGISVNVEIINQSADRLNVSSTKLGISNHILYTNTAEQVIITLSYNSSALVDGSFEVTLGDIYLTYGTQMTNESPNFPKPCKLTDTNSNSTADTGEIITCTNERFYVVKNNTTTIDMLTEQNIDGSFEYDTSSSTYWADYLYNSNYDYYSYVLKDEYKDNLYVYDSNSPMYTYVENYVDKLQSLGVDSASATLMSLQDIKELGCDESMCTNAPSWVYSTNYWLGSVSSNDYTLLTVQSSGEIYNNYGYSTGIRPLVNISVDELG